MSLKKTHSGVKLTKTSNLHDTYYIEAFMLDEWEVRLCTNSNFLSFVMAR